MSIENKKISEEELENVNGGCNETAYFPGNKSNYSDYTVPVDKYCGVIGKKYLFDDPGNGRWLFGVLVNSYEKNEVFYSTRTHDVKVEDAYGFDKDKKNYILVSEYGTKEIVGAQFQMYAKAGE